MAEKSLMWLIYRRARVGFAFMGFIIMYAVFTGAPGSRFAMISISVFFAELFGACYNDSTDFEEDVRNNRSDKLTVSNVLTLPQIKFVSLIMLAGSLVSAYVSGFLPVSILYALLMWAYSYPKIRLKKYHIAGYIALALTWLIIPLYLGHAFKGAVSSTDVLFGLFFSAQYAYLLSQKDSTDMKDKTNMFIEKGWEGALNICSTLAIFSCLFLLILSFRSTILITLWGANAAIKIRQARKVHLREISRDARSNFTLMEFTTPYLFSGGAFFAF